MSNDISHEKNCFTFIDFENIFSNVAFSGDDPCVFSYFVWITGNQHTYITCSPRARKWVCMCVDWVSFLKPRAAAIFTFAPNAESSCCQKHYSYWNLLQEDNHLNSRTSEASNILQIAWDFIIFLSKDEFLTVIWICDRQFACSPTKSACSGPQSADHARSMSIHGEKVWHSHNWHTS